jgi:hypothetical protein
MRMKTVMGMFVLAVLVPTAAWATEGVIPVGAVMLSGAGAAAVGFAGFLGLKLYNTLRGGELGAAWQSAAFALLFLGVAMLVDTVGAAGWLPLSAYIGGLLKVLAAGGLVLSFIRFAKVFK